MVDRVNGIRGGSGWVGRAKPADQVDQKTTPKQQDQVDISPAGARAAANVGRFVDFVKATPDVRADQVRLARADIDEGAVLSEENTEKLARKVLDKFTKGK